MTSIKEMVDLTSKTVLDHLDHDAEVPRINSIAAQGDVLIHRVTTRPATTPMPRTVIVVQSEASTNTHTLHPNGTCYYDAIANPRVIDPVIGTLTVPEESTAFLSHQEHAGIEVLPGTYEIRRQRELAGEWAFVND